MGEGASSPKIQSGSQHQKMKELMWYDSWVRPSHPLRFTSISLQNWVSLARAAPSSLLVQKKSLLPFLPADTNSKGKQSIRIAHVGPEDCQCDVNRVVLTCDFCASPCQRRSSGFTAVADPEFCASTPGDIKSTDLEGRTIATGLESWFAQKHSAPDAKSKLRDR